MQHEEVEELLGVYALDAVPPDELAAIEDHLAECPRCRGEVARHREVAAMLGNAGGVAPDGVWERIAGELSFEHSVRPDAAGAAEILAERAASRPHLLTGGSPAAFSPRGQAASGRRRRWLTAGAAGIGALAAALAIVVGILSARVADLDHQVSEVQRTVGSQSLVSEALAASLDPSNVQVRLSPATPAQPAARLIVDPSTDTAYFVSTGLAPLPGNRTYQLWSLVRGKPVSLGLLGSRPVANEVQVAPDMSTFMVTAEPEGGTPLPTGPIIIKGSVPTTA